MNALDWSVLGIYMAFIMGLGAYLSKGQESMDDYFKGGGCVPWWQTGLSTMATQLGAISFVSAPAFVALKEGGGMRWLAYEFGVPIGLLIVMVVLIPVLFKAKVTSIYEYLEMRYDSGTRILVSILFQIGRGLGTAVAVLAGGIILSTALSISTPAAILVIGIVTIIYDMMGGIKGVIVSDVIQMVFILAGILLCAGYALYLVGWAEAWNLDASRALILDFKSMGFNKEGSQYGFWPMTLGGIILYASYYGCDQSQVQRELSVATVHDVRKSLLLNAVGRFPLVLLYCCMGLFVGAVAKTSGFATKVGAAMGLEPVQVTQLLASDPDRLIPMFILSYLPHGIIGLLFVAILSALMSSLDSALNSMSAVTLSDVYKRYFKPDGSDEHYLFASKMLTVFWGIFCIGFALIFCYSGEGARETTIVMINAIGSVLYGPILSVFLLGMLISRINGTGVKFGVISGAALNAYIWMFSDISWMWMNVFGFLATSLVSLSVSFLTSQEKVVEAFDLKESSSRSANFMYVLVLIYFVFLLGACHFLQSSFGA